MKRKFVKVMFFGALALSTVTYVGCKDYDDDVKGLQEQIDKINAKEPGVSTEAMSSAIQNAVASLKTQLETVIAGKADNASVQALQTKVNELVAALDGKADASKITELVKQISELSTKVNEVEGSLNKTKEALEKEISGLEEQIAELKKQIGETTEDTSVRDQLNKLTADLATAQNEHKRIDQAIQNNAGKIVELTENIAKLQKLNGRIDALEDAHANFLKIGDLDAYYTKEEISDIIDTELTSYMTSEEVTAYVDEIVKTKVLTEITAINNRLDVFDRDLSKVSSDFAKYCEDQTLAYNKVIDRIKTLENYKSVTLEKLETTVDNQGKDLAQAMLDIKDLTDKFAGYATTDALGNVETSLRSYVDAEISKCTTKMTTLENTLKTLRVDVDGLMNRIQSVTYLPDASDRKVNFYTFYAKGKNTDDTYKVINLGGISTQDVKFRVSPASAVKDFFSKYDVEFSADQVVTKSLSTEYFTFDKGEVTSNDEGIITFKLRPNTTESYAVCMRVVTKDGKEESVGKVEITSDYFAAMVSDKFIVNAFYKFDGTVDQNIIYTDATSKADYSNGEIMLQLSDNDKGTLTNDQQRGEALTNYPALEASFNTVFTVDNADFFEIGNKSSVLLKSYNTPSYIGKTTNVYAKVIPSGLYTPATSSQIGTVEAVVKKNTATITYGEQKVEWNINVNPIDASHFPLSTIYDNPAVRLTPTAFAGIQKHTIKDTPKVKFVVGAGNALSIGIEPKTPAGTYYPEVTFTTNEGDLEITVKCTVVITNPEIDALATDPVLWKDGKVGLTMTPDDVNTLSSIALSMNLFELFTNYDNVKQQAKDKNAVFTVDVPNWKNISGISYDETTGVLTIDDPKSYKPASKLGVSATVTLPGTTEPLQNLYATITLPNASGSWKAGLTTVVFNSQAEKKNLAEGFVWSDMRKPEAKEMWANGEVVKGDGKNGFASTVTDALAVYGLNAPVFVFCDENGKNETSTDKFLSLDSATGSLTVADKIQGWDFKTDYTIYVKVKASSQWGAISGYDNAHSIIKVTIPEGTI